MSKLLRGRRPLTTKEACAALGVSLRALHRYQVKGWLTPVADPFDRRRRLYPVSEVRKLRAAKGGAA